MKLWRSTERVGDYSGETVLLEGRSGRTFRVARIMEALAQFPQGEGYEVELSGPVQTTRGRDHVALRGKQSYTLRASGISVPLDTLPKELNEHLVGPDWLRDRQTFGPDCYT